MVINFSDLHSLFFCFQVGDAKKTYTKDGAASQQHQPQPTTPATSNAAKKPPIAPGRKSEPKPRGQADSSDVAGSEVSKPGSSKRTAPKNGTNKTNEGSASSKGTVKPYANFDADSDCEKLNSAMSEENGEKTIVAIIPKRSNKQRQQLKTTYEQKYKKVRVLIVYYFLICKP